MPSVIVAGAGLAGLAAAVALADAGFEVQLFESRPYPGGRATSYPVPRGDGSSLVLDNCQHILLRCCVNLLDLYRRLGVSGDIEFHREFYWIEPGGRTSVFRAGRLPAPAHFTESFARLKFLNAGEKFAVGRAMLAALRERASAAELDRLSMSEWLRLHHQPERAIARFWRQILVSAVNEELDRMSAFHGLQVFRLSFLGSRDAYEMGVPLRDLGDLYRVIQSRNDPHLTVRFRAGVASLDGACRLSDGMKCKADYYVAAVPVHRVESIIAGYSAPSLEHSPITGVHLWFDRCVTELPHATLLDRNIHWMFNKGDGRHLQIVISASDALTRVPKADVVELCCRELAEFFPAVATAKLVGSHVVKELRATISARPGVASMRPGPGTARPDVFVAGDWTATGWPSTMEGAVRSGYAAADAVCRAAGRTSRFLLDND